MSDKVFRDSSDRQQLLTLARVAVDMITAYRRYLKSHMPHDLDAWKEQEERLYRLALETVSQGGSDAQP